MAEGKEIQKWADAAMFTAEPSDATNGPRVYLLSAPADPLGSIAAAAKMYKGEVVRDLAEVSDGDRHYYLGEMQKTKLKMPLEAVTFHFLLDGVTRAFTHQLVRQRTAAYAQESMRFAVVEDSFFDRIALPPSLAWANERIDDGRTRGDVLAEEFADVNPNGPAFDRLPENVRKLLLWRHSVAVTQRTYQRLVDTGMPAEDARGLLPTNITTRVHYITNLRGLLDHAGNRLCTQAQFEWRLVFSQVAKVLREFGIDENGHTVRDTWQYQAIAQLLQPACYQAGKCVFDADFDRKCSIRDRVNAYADRGIPSSQWDKGHYPLGTGELNIHPINPIEWLADPGAAR